MVSDFGKAAQSGCLKKEQPFVLGVSADTIYPELLERQEEEEELLIVQGIIDVYFEEPDGIASWIIRQTGQHLGKSLQNDMRNSSAIMEKCWNGLPERE